MDDFRTERLGSPAQASDVLTPESRRESDNRQRRRPRPVKPPAPKPFEDQEDPDDTRHELDELA
jgi:hypothetical protein